jgi:hypothetical protein
MGWFMAKKSFDDYIQGLGSWKAQIVSKVRLIILKAAPQAKESIKWSQPVYESNGPICYIKAFKNNVNFGFWRGVDIEDTTGLLKGTGKKMRHVKLTKIDDIDEETFVSYVHQAVKLNLMKGDPIRSK